MSTVSREALILNVGKLSYQSIKVPISDVTETVTIEIERPTSINAVVWDEKTTLAVKLSVEIDGQLFQCDGQSTGGIRNGPTGEVGVYYLSYSLPCGFFSGESCKRLGETKSATFTLQCQIALIDGLELQSTVYIYTAEAPAPVIARHNSVAFDAATSATEGAGDGTVTLSHTATGSDRAAFIGVSASSNFAAGWSSTPPTYNGVSSTELWDFQSDIWPVTNAGNYLVAPATGSQTVSSTITGGASLVDHNLMVITMTGVDAGTPVGTAVTNSGSAGSNPSVTVGSVGTDDMVVDNFAVTNSSTAPTVGANQTERNAVSGGFPSRSRQSTQAGSDGGTMSWTHPGTCSLGAVNFKAVAAAGTTRGTPFGHRGTAFNGGRTFHGIIQ